MHKRFWLWLMVLMAFCLCSHSYGADTPLKFRRYSLDDGLSQGSVLTITQDKQGFLWLGTQDGLNRFDGYEFKVFQRDEDQAGSLSASYVPTLLVDHKDDLWVGTTNGLHKLNRDNETFTVYPLGNETRENIGSQYIRTLYPGPDNKIWVGTYGGLFLFDPASGQYQRFEHDPADLTSLSNNRIYTLLTDRQNRLWVGTDEGVNILAPGEKTFAHITHLNSNPNSLSGPKVSALLQDKQGFIWAGTYSSGLNRIDPQSRQVSRYRHDENSPNTISQDRVRSLLVDRYGVLWVGTSFGVNLYNRNTDDFTRYRNDPIVQSSLSNNYIWEMLEDNNDSIWLATSDGINQYVHSTRFFGHRQKTAVPGQGLSHKRVRSILKTTSDELWVGVDNGLNHLDPQTGLYKYYQHDPLDNKTISRGMVMSVIEDQQNRIWAGTYDGGLNLLLPSGEFEHFTHDPDDPDSLSHARVYNIAQDKAGILWLATLDGLNRFDPTTRTFKLFFHEPDNPDSLSNDSIYAALPSASGDIWVATRDGGVNRFTPSTGKFQRFEHDPADPQSISHNRVFALYQSNDIELWAATSRGLNRLDITTGKFARFGKKQGLINGTIYAVTGDEQGFIWMSTNRGLVRFNPVTSRFKHFDRVRGLQSNEFNNGAFFNAHDGELFFGGINGFNRFYPWQIKDNAMMPKVAITQFYLANKPPGLAAQNPGSPLSKVINQTRQLTLNHENPVLSFEFTALHFINPKKNRFAYILDGFDNDWTYTHAQHRRATYTNLPAGDYTFRVKAANSDGIWGDTNQPIVLSIVAAPWKTMWAYAIYTLLIGGTIGAFVLQYYLRQKAVKESENRLSLALWGSGNEFWDWDIRHDNLMRSNNSGDFSLPSGADFSINSLKPLIHPEDFDPLQQAFTAHHVGRTEYFEFAYRLRNNQNEWIWVLDRGQVVTRNELGEPLRALGTIQNINDLKKIEGELRQLNEQLELRVEQRTGELATTVERFAATIEQLTMTQEQLVEAEKMAALGGLVSGVAHEINTPVGICITSISALELACNQFFQLQTDGKLTRNDFERFKQTCNETISLMIGNLNKTAELVQSFKMVAVEQSGDRRSMCNINQLFEQIIDGFTTRLDDSKTTITLLGDTNVCTVCFVASLDLVLTNLINNSLLHGLAQSKDGQINITIQSGGDYVLINYHDNGCGLQNVSKEQVFEPFYTTRRGKGQTGLGMHIVYNHMTQRLNGSIEIDDSHPQGLAFNLTLPLTKD